MKARHNSTQYALRDANDTDTWEEAFALDAETQEELSRYDHAARFGSFTCFVLEQGQ